MIKLLSFSLFLSLLKASQGLDFLTQLILITINEEEPVGSFVAQALAGPSPVRYELGAGAAQLFVINNATGNITIQSHIDREVLNATQGSFMVFAFDDGGNKASASVYYWITDINDHYPHFSSQHYNVTVGEATDVNQQIFTVTAQDEDIEANAEILYEIVAGNEVGICLLNGCLNQDTCKPF
ncbi:cadherin-18-like [Porites lutea]|uniref:cadherin-18-like n=1 Tax=Porites lutea TaxID=51062 RepID=UPI003CC6C864